MKTAGKVLIIVLAIIGLMTIANEVYDTYLLKELLTDEDSVLDFTDAPSDVPFATDTTTIRTLSDLTDQEIEDLRISSGYYERIKDTVPVKKTIEIVSIDTKITDQNQYKKQFAWKVEIENRRSFPVVVHYRLRWLDDDDFEVSSDLQLDQSLKPGLNSFGGSQRISMPSASKVASIEAKIERVR